MAQKTCVRITGSKDESKIIYVCLDGIKEISNKILKERERKFKTIAECIFRNITNKDMYDTYPQYKGTAVIKLSKGKENFRIYCKVENCTTEQNIVQRITMVKLYHKKEQKLPKQAQNILEKIQNNNYDYKEWPKPT